jgi:orotate phosphoribosyltransferase
VRHDTQASGRLLEVVLERGYERREEAFRLSSGGTSHDYVDLRRAVARGDALEIAAKAVLEQAEGLGIEFDVIGGMTMGADPVSHATALLSGREWFSVRKESKGHGTARRVEGANLGPDRRALLFEDTVSTGRSLLEALDVVVETGADVVLALTLLDRGTTAAPAFAARGVTYSAILTYEDLGIEPIPGAPGAAANT